MYEDHLKHLADVFEALSKYGMKLKPSKCHLVKPKVEYLGHVVSAEVVAPDPEKITAIRNWPIPTNIKEVRQFLGLMGYYRCLIKGYTKMAAPMQNLLVRQTKHVKTSGTPFTWGEEQESSFQQIKSALT
ncbi:uncharacterized protein ACNLHF_022735 [Anomaloglossus baeobatrachus]|uniref:uncharacterized protein LOC142243935 n=1 Tax=Anomaloglossus baeobatrachus TaxID=238106 RepID=UPI003F50575C